MNGHTVRRSPSGYFAPTVSLDLGTNAVEVRHGNERLSICVTRLPAIEAPMSGTSPAPGSLFPDAPEAFMPGELAFFRLSALPGADVEVVLGDRRIRLEPQPSPTPPQIGVDSATEPVLYEGAMRLPEANEAGEEISLGDPSFVISKDGSLASYPGQGDIALLSPERRDTVEIVDDRCAARSAPSEDAGRIITLPKGARSGVSGMYGEWYRLDCGYWILKTDAQVVSCGPAGRPRLGDVSVESGKDGATIRFELSAPAAAGAFQREGRLDLTFYGVETWTKTLRLVPGLLVKGAQWSEPSPGTVVFSFAMENLRQWGYRLHYEGSDLILELRSEPRHRVPFLVSLFKPLSGTSFVLDPGHGGHDRGAIGPNGALEKDLNLAFALKLRNELRRRGADVYMTRETDVFVSLSDRVDFIEAHKPALALSIHHNSLPDGMDAEDISGFGAYWYNEQAFEPAASLFRLFVSKTGNRADGVFWDDLALPRTTGAPTVLLEMGYMSNPWDFEFLIEPKAQDKRARALADAIVEWTHGSRR